MALNYKDLRKVKGNPCAEVAPGRRLKLNPSQDHQYDMPKELIDIVTKKFPLKSLLNSETGETEESLKEKGQTFMRWLITQADSDSFRDRTTEMIDLVAKQTGIRFPHSFERYVELGILTLRPRDAWTITEATTKKLTVRSYSCTLGKGLLEQGVGKCEAFCLAACQTVAQKIGVNLEMAKTKDLVTNGMCELEFNLEKAN